MNRLVLGMHVHRRGHRLLTNDVLNFILQSCPRLDFFSLKGRLDCEWGPVELNFAGLDINNVVIDVQRTAFYVYRFGEISQLRVTPRDSKLKVIQKKIARDQFTTGSFFYQIHIG